MKNIILKYIRAIGYKLINLSKLIENRVGYKLYIKYQQDKGDITKRLDYPLSSNSVVFDLGGYEGQFASDIYAKYGCKVFVFEPVKEFCDFIKKRFENNEKIIAFEFALSNQNKIGKLFLADNATSAYSKTGKSVEIKYVDIKDFMIINHVEKVDLMKINIEGGEYDIFEYLVKNNEIVKFSNIQVQFHDFVPDAIKRRQHLREVLSHTHKCTYNYEFIWENWKIK